VCQEVCPWNARFPGEVTGAWDAEDGVAKRGPTGEAAAAYRATAWPADREGDPALPSPGGPDLIEFTDRVRAMSGKEYQRVFAESPLARPGRKGMLRNLCGMIQQAWDLKAAWFRVLYPDASAEEIRRRARSLVGEPAP
jgi:hypothetical protein